MKTIGIITIHNSQNNYGGVLQCYALYYYLVSQGYPTEIIDLRRPNHPDFISSIRYRNMRSKYRISTIIKGYIKEIFHIRKLRNPNFRPTWNAEAGVKFDAFNSMMKLSVPYSYIPDIYKTPPYYDVYISGSDQLWNPEQPYCLEPYFLTFVKGNKCKKVSYATSIGISSLFENEKKLFAKWLLSYDNISVRESEGQKLLSSFVKKPIEKVPDPTMLLEPDFWTSLEVKPQFECPYILVFSLFREKSLLEKAISMAKEANMLVCVIDQNYPGNPISSVKIVNNAGPCDFIGLIHHASLVITDSFHCTDFSIITGTKNFYTYINPENKRGSRIIDLLKTFHLSGHLITDVNQLQNYKSISNICIDKDMTRAILISEQKIGRSFLKMAIG